MAAVGNGDNGGTVAVTISPNFHNSRFYSIKEIIDYVIVMSRKLEHGFWITHNSMIYKI